MKHIIFFCAFILILSACSSTPVATSVPENFDEKAVVVVIKDPRPARRKQSTVSTGYQSRINYDIDPLLSQASQAIANDYQLNISYEWPIRSLDAHCFVVETNNPDQIIALLNNDSRVRFAQALNSFLGSSSENQIPSENEKRLSRPVKPNSIQSLYHAENQYGKGQRIAVIDTLADIDHPDLNNSDIRQWDLLGRSRGQSQERHGTAVLGLIAAQHANGIGINGAAPQAKIGLFRGCWQVTENAIHAKCDTVALSLALDAAVRWKPDVINLSLSGPPDRLLEEFIAKMTEHDGVIVVAAFDEQRDELNRFPRKRPGVIFAYGQNDQLDKTFASNIIAIGQKDAFTLQPDGNYDVLSGHSMAAPIVSSLIALYKESQPNASTQVILNKLKSFETKNL